MAEDERTRRLREAARAYATVVRELGIGIDEALTAARTHLTDPTPGHPPPGP
jgi:hypothetical protein